jgi:uncharacterized protein (TIGR00299 family) protein
MSKRHLHFDCFSGISGDMTLSALVDAGLPLKDLTRALGNVPATGYRLRSKRVMRAGMQATKIDVVIERGLTRPLSLAQIQRLISRSGVPGLVKDQAQTVFRRLADAEGLAHRVSPDKVQFHEVGVIDSIVDVIGSLLGCHLLGIGRVTASSVNLGSGMTMSSHGRLPAPGPAVAALARGLPVYSAGPARELTTPTGLALLVSLTDEFGGLPLMRPTSIGHGAGSADPEGWPNVLRVFIGSAGDVDDPTSDTVVQIETNLDDVNPQTYDMVMDRLFAVGALDVSLTPLIMKQGRPGILLAVLCPPAKAREVAGVLLRDTTTLGVRVREVTRLVLSRRTETVRIAGGGVRIKVARSGPDTVKASPEYLDCKRIALQTGRPIRDVMDDAMVAYRLARRKKTTKS